MLGLRIPLVSGMYEETSVEVVSSYLTSVQAEKKIHGDCHKFRWIGMIQVDFS